MASAGIRELRQRARELLRRVEQGETIEITDRGRPVALLLPLPEGGALERLRAAGDVDELPPPLVVASDVEKPSSALARLRVQER